MDGLEKDPQLLNQAHFRITYNGPKPKNRMQLNAASLLLQAAYVTCLIAVWSFLIFEIVLCFQKYEQWPTYHNHTILQQKHAKFPDITFCTAGKHGLKAKVLLKHGLSVDGYVGKPGSRETTGWKSLTDEQMTPEKLFTEASYSLESLVENISVLQMTGNDMHLVVGNNVTSSLANIFEKTDVQLGKCYTLRLTNLTREDGIFLIHVVRKTPIAVYVHTPDMFQDVINRRAITLFNDTLDYYVEYKVNYEMQKRQKDMSNCETYNYDNGCWYDKFERDIRSATLDNCTIPWAINNTNICKKRETVQSALMSLDKIVKERFSCPKSCLSMPISLTGGAIRGPPDKVSLKLRFSPYVQVSKEEDLYTVLSLIAEVGGYVGLLCGYSILTLIQWLYQTLKRKIQ